MLNAAVLCLSFISLVISICCNPLMSGLLSALFENLSCIGSRFADAAGGVASGYELVAGAGEVLLVCA